MTVQPFHSKFVAFMYLFMGGLCNAFQVKQLPSVVLKAAKEDDGDGGTLLLDSIDEIVITDSHPACPNAYDGSIGQ